MSNVKRTTKEIPQDYSESSELSIFREIRSNSNLEKKISYSKDKKDKQEIKKNLISYLLLEENLNKKNLAQENEAICSKKLKEKICKNKKDFFHIHTNNIQTQNIKKFPKTQKDENKENIQINLNKNLNDDNDYNSNYLKNKIKNNKIKSKKKLHNLKINSTKNMICSNEENKSNHDKFSKSKNNKKKRNIKIEKNEISPNFSFAQESFESNNFPINPQKTQENGIDVRNILSLKNDSNVNHRKTNKLNLKTISNEIKILDNIFAKEKFNEGKIIKNKESIINLSEENNSVEIKNNQSNAFLKNKPNFKINSNSNKSLNLIEETSNKNKGIKDTSITVKTNEMNCSDKINLHSSYPLSTTNIGNKITNITENQNLFNHQGVHSNPLMLLFQNPYQNLLNASNISLLNNVNSIQSNLLKANIPNFNIMNSLNNTIDETQYNKNVNLKIQNNHFLGYKRKNPIDNLFKNKSPADHSPYQKKIYNYNNQYKPNNEYGRRNNLNNKNTNSTHPHNNQFRHFNKYSLSNNSNYTHDENQSLNWKKRFNNKNNDDFKKKDIFYNCNIGNIPGKNTRFNQFKRKSYENIYNPSNNKNDYNYIFKNSDVSYEINSCIQKDKVIMDSSQFLNMSFLNIPEKKNFFNNQILSQGKVEGESEYEKKISNIDCISNKDNLIPSLQNFDLLKKEQENDMHFIDNKNVSSNIKTKIKLDKEENINDKVSKDHIKVENEDIINKHEKVQYSSNNSIKKEIPYYLSLYFFIKKQILNLHNLNFSNEMISLIKLFNNLKRDKCQSNEKLLESLVDKNTNHIDNNFDSNCTFEELNKFFNFLQEIHQNKEKFSI